MDTDTSSPTELSIVLPIKITIEPTNTILSTMDDIITKPLLLSSLYSLHIRWLCQAVATRIQELSKTLHIALIPKQAKICYNNINELLSPNMKISDFLTHYFHDTNLLTKILKQNNTNPIPLIHVELQALSEYQPKALHTIRSPDPGVPRTIWQGCAFNMSDSGRHAVQSSLKYSQEIHHRITEEEHIHKVFQYITETAGTYGAFIDWLEHQNSTAISESDIVKFSTYLDTVLPWLPLDHIAPEPKDLFKIRVCIITHYYDFCRLFQHYGTCHGNNINDITQYTMQHNQLLHFCQVANMFPLPVSTVRVEEAFQTCAMPITKTTITLSPQGTQQTSTKHTPIKVLTILSFIRMMVIVADHVFTNEVNTQSGGKNGPGRAVEKMIKDHFIPLSARITGGTTRRMIQDVSNRRWIEPHVPVLRDIFAYYAEVDEAAANSVKQSFTTTSNPLSSASNNNTPLSPRKQEEKPKTTIDFPTLYRERRSMRLNEFTKIIVDAGLAPNSVLNPNASSSNNNKGTSTPGYTLTANDIRAAYYGAIALTDIPDYGIDFSGRPKEDDPYERMASVDEFIEALVRISYYRWSSMAQLVLNLDPNLEELERILKNQQTIRKHINDSADVLSTYQLTLLANKDPRNNKNSQNGKHDEEITEKKKDLPKNTRRVSISVDNIFTLSNNTARRGSIVGLMHAKEKLTNPLHKKDSDNGTTTNNQTKPKAMSLIINKPSSKSELENILLTPRTAAATLMNTLQGADTLEKPTKASEIELFTTFMRWVIEAVSETINHLGTPVPKLVTYDITALVKRLNIEAITITATLANSNNVNRPTTETPSMRSYIPLPHIPEPIIERNDPKKKNVITSIKDVSDQVWKKMFTEPPVLDLHITVIEDTNTDHTKHDTNNTTNKNKTGKSSTTSPNKTSLHDTLYELEDHALGIHQLTHNPHQHSHNPHNAIAAISILKPEKDVQKHTTPVKSAFNFRI